MADYGALVMALKQGRTWEQVATLCDGKRLGHAGAYYCEIAVGGIKTPHLAARNAIDKAALACGLSALKRTSKPDSPLGVSIGRELGERINQWRCSHSLTWNEWAGLAHDLMRREYGKGSEGGRAYGR